MIDIFTHDRVIAEEIFSVCPDLQPKQYKLDASDPDGEFHCFYDMLPEAISELEGDYVRDSDTGEVLDPDMVYQNYNEGE